LTNFRGVIQPERKLAGVGYNSESGLPVKAYAGESGLTGIGYTGGSGLTGVGYIGKSGLPGVAYTGEYRSPLWPTQGSPQKFYSH
jgi:hypothetical protein